MSQKPKILVVCSRNKKRSLTAEKMYNQDQRLEIRSAGTSPKARHKISPKDIAWADIILCMETKHKQIIQKTFTNIPLPQIKVLNIEDIYEFMDPDLMKMLEVEIEGVLGKLCRAGGNRTPTKGFGDLYSTIKLRP